MDIEYKICTKTIMDTTDPDIQFNEYGVSNHWYRYQEMAKKYLADNNQLKRRLDILVNQIKLTGKKNQYDCIIGVSGGVDSTYVAYIVKELGLRPLAVHFDNGWNSELAVKNIEKILNTLNIDLYTYVVDWEEFKDIQMAFLKASTPDSEIPTDHAIIALLYQIAVKYKVKYILNGVNVKSESIMPIKWGYGYFDLTYIKDIHRKFGTKKLKTLPTISLLKLAYYSKIKKIQFVPILNYVSYEKEEAMKLIEDKLGWVYYGGKHYESIYTRFFQSYILPIKFNIDKRRAHLSNLICSEQITRDEAIEEIKKVTYDLLLMEEDKEYVIKKFGICNEEFEDIMNLPTKTFLDYKNNFSLLQSLKNIFKKL
jgi:N-acetyl sugar amidotransferase